MRAIPELYVVASFFIECCSKTRPPFASAITSSDRIRSMPAAILWNVGQRRNATMVVRCTMNHFSSSILDVAAIGDLLKVHHWPAFLTVVCLGLIQVTVTYYSGTLAIESLPGHVSAKRRRSHRRVFGLLVAVFIGLTFLLAKLNDSNQNRAEVIADQEKLKQEMLQTQLRQTLNAVLDSQDKLQGIKRAVDGHPSSAERSAMLSSINQIQQNLQHATVMKQAELQ